MLQAIFGGWASQEFWDAEYERIHEIDPLIEQVRGTLSVG